MKKFSLILLSMLMSFSLIGRVSNVSAETGSEAQALLNSIINTPPTIREGKIVLPSIHNDNYKVELAGSSNEAVIDKDGNVHEPLEAMNVQLMYRVVNKTDNENFAMEDNKDVSLSIPGKYVHEQNDNKRPEIVPGIREWKGNSGKFSLRSSSKIIVEDETLMNAGEHIAYYFNEMLETDISVEIGNPQAGDIYLKSSSRKELGSEGNYIEIDNIVAIESNCDVGAVYGGATLTQMLTQDEDHNEMPKGVIRDYPAYAVRAAMLDVARFYMPIEYLEELTKYMAYFKMNEIQVHINDDGGEQAASFRVESKKFPLVNSGLKKDEVYTQNQYRQYQKNVKPFGIDVITEIDTPAHCRFVGLHDQSLLLDDSHINLKNPKAVQFIQDLCDEFLDGEDPVFQSKKFHVGADEYRRGEGHDDDYVKYLNQMIAYVNDRDLEARMWASLGGGGMNSATPVDTRVTSNYWAYSWANFPKMISDGFKCINTSTDLYVVPGTSTGYVDYLDLKKLYETWQVNVLGGGTTISSAHPLLVGGQSALWYDRKVGMSQFDYFDRFRDQVMLVSEKSWFGNKEASQTADEFLSRIDKVDKKAPGSNPGRHVESKTETVVECDFNDMENSIIADKSGNGYDAAIDNLNLTEGKKGNGLALNGTGSFTLPFDSIGFPYTISMDLFVDEKTPENALLFAGKDGKLYLNYEGTGKIGYERKGYKYILDCKIETGRWQNILLTCNFFGMSLYIDNVFEAAAVDYENQSAIPESSTFILPTEKIGQGVIGRVDNFKIINKFSSKEEMTGTEILDYRNIALHKPVTASSEGHWSFAKENAVDGNTDTNFQPKDTDDEWLQVDLEDTYQIDKIEIAFTEKPNKYKVLVSEDGTTWEQIHEDLDGIGQSSGTDVINVNIAKSVRYVKYQQMERFTAGGGIYSGKFSELRVFVYAGLNAMQPILDDANAAIQATPVTSENEKFVGRFQKNIQFYEAALKSGTMEEKAWIAKQLKNQTARLLNGETAIPTIDLANIEHLLATEIDESEYDETTLDKYYLMCRNTRYVLIDVDADQAKINATARKLKECLDVMFENHVSVTASKEPYKDSVLTNCVDGDLSTQLIVSSQEVGDWYLFKMRFPMKLKNMHVISTSDYLEGADIEVSMDGNNWTKVGALKNVMDQMIEFNEVDVKYVRFVLTAPAQRWLRIDEIVFNEEVVTDDLEDMIAEDYASNDYTPNTYKVYEGAKTAAQELLKQGSYTQEAIDTAYANLSKAIEGLIARANMIAINQKIEAAEKINKDLYTKESIKILDTALNAAKEIVLNLNATQEDVDKAASNVHDAINELVKKGDKTELSALIKTASKLDKADYTVKSFKVLEDALHAAKVVQDDVNATQAQLDEAHNKLKKAVDTLEKKQPVITPEEPEQGEITIASPDNAVVMVGKLPNGTKVKVIELSKEEIKKVEDRINIKNASFLNTAVIEKILDVRLLLDEQEYQPDGAVKITFTLDERLWNQKVGIIYIDDEGNITKIPTIIKDGKISFKTSHFSHYAIVTYKENKVGVETNDRTNTALLCTIMIGALAVTCLMLNIKRRKKMY